MADISIKKDSQPSKTANSNKIYSKLNKKEKNTIERENVEKFRNFIQQYNIKAEQYIKISMPQKIAEINKFYNSIGKKKLCYEDVTKYLPDELKKYTFEDRKRKVNVENKELIAEIRAMKVKGPKPESLLKRRELKIPTNKEIKEMSEKLKTECLAFLTMAGDLKLWIQLNIPRIEDGNNFGVTVQEEVISDLSVKEDMVINIIEDIAKYFNGRAKVIQRVVKFPNVEDYVCSLVEHDDRAFIEQRMNWLDLRNAYLNSLDLIRKNSEKLRKPRRIGAYQSMF